jgi:hypothetical protein
MTIVAIFPDMENSNTRAESGDCAPPPRHSLGLCLLEHIPIDNVLKKFLPT